MLLSSGCSRDAKTKVEKTALHLAAGGGHSSIIELLLNANSDANPKDMVCPKFVSSLSYLRLQFWNAIT